MASEFHWADYLVFSLMLAISAGIGIIFGFIDRKKKSSEHFLLGGGDLKVFPVGMSLLASFLSAIAILGYSAEMYRYGTMYWAILIGYVFSQGFTALVFIPFFHNLGLTSAYQYLEIRFSNSVRLLTSFIFCVQMLLYMSVALYTPSLAIRQVTGIGLEVSIIVTGLICCLYTVIGGLKATVWIDTFQILIMISGLVLIIIMGTLQIEGGMSEIFYRMTKSDRVEFFDFDPNPLKRHTFWTLFVGGIFTNMTTAAASQNSIQRYMSVKKWTSAAKAVVISYIGLIIIISLTCLCGIVAFANYHDCDLLTTNRVEKSEQILPFYVMEILGSLHGLPGLFIATVYSAALSTISASMNSLACVTITDFVKPGLKYFWNTTLSEKKLGIVTKLLALAFGLVGIGIAYACDYLSGQVLQFTLSIFGLLGGPILGVLSLGMFVPYANWIGALVGMIVSISINLWIGIGAILNTVATTKPISISGCDPNLNYTIKPTIINDKDYLAIYDLSYLHYSTLAVLIVFVVGLIVSYITQTAGFEHERLDEKYYALRFIFKSKKHTDKITVELNNFNIKNWYDTHLIETTNKQDKDEISNNEQNQKDDKSNVNSNENEKIIQNDLNEIRFESASF